MEVLKEIPPIIYDSSDSDSYGNNERKMAKTSCTHQF